MTRTYFIHVINQKWLCLRPFVCIGIQNIANDSILIPRYIINYYLLIINPSSMPTRYMVQ